MCCVSQLAGLTNVIQKMCFFCRINAVGHATYYKVPDMSARLNECGLFICESVWLPDCSPISCFHNIFTLLFTNIVLPWIVYCFLHGVLPPCLWDIFWLLFNMCVLNVIAIAVVGPVCMCLWVVFDLFWDSIQWISLSVCMFCGLVMYVGICCYRCWLDMSSVASDSSASCCELYSI